MVQIVVLDGATLNPGDNPWTPLQPLGELTIFDRTPPTQVVARARHARQVEAELKKIWPDLEYVWLWDKGYWKGTKDQVERLMDKSKLKDVQFVADFFDCDDFAAQFKEEVRRTRYFAWKEGLFGGDPPVPYAIFFAAGDMFRGVGEMHAVNLVILRDPDPGVWIVDMMPQERIMWKANPQMDNVYFVSS